MYELPLRISSKISMYVVSAGKDILRFASSGTAFALSASVASNVLFMSSTYHLLLSVSVGKTRFAFSIASTKER